MCLADPPDVILGYIDIELLIDAERRWVPVS
jgi:hypothetical protein